jgi:hypothetical protein
VTVIARVIEIEIVADPTKKTGRTSVVDSVQRTALLDRLTVGKAGPTGGEALRMDRNLRIHHRNKSESSYKSYLIHQCYI